MESGENKNSGKIFIEKILDKKNRNCDYRNELLSSTLILLFLEHSLFALQGAGSWMGKGAEYIILIQSRR